jgi:hypothetical protein
MKPANQAKKLASLGVDFQQRLDDVEVHRGLVTRFKQEYVYE